ncbi:MAG TPA: glycogen debranching N-terminal domain-containing protein [Kofleriaceae bacterium]|nr:glycogen debranching N-terminal domain-containing protein [Kofleriaceae bacterium]
MPHKSTQLHEGYYILATKTRADERTRVIKDGDSFGVFDHSGMIRQVGLGELGLYHEGTRYLSLFEIGIERRRPMLLNSTVLSDNVLNVDLANPDLPDLPEPLPRDSIHMFAQSLLWQASCVMRLSIHNYALEPVNLELSFIFDADHADIFEVRGIERLRRGRRRDPIVRADHVILPYEGLDQVVRATRISFDPAPALLEPKRASYRLVLEPQREVTIRTHVLFEIGDRAVEPISFEVARDCSCAEVESRRSRTAIVEVSNPRFQEWIERSESDIDMMVSKTPYGPYPYAGVPWFSTPFGRDGIITAYQRLWLDPGLARGVLAFLAATQAQKIDAENDAEPGKIIHEMRGGEMAALGEVPFGRYYGSIDATPLFVVLAGAYYRRTADRALIEKLWPNIEGALGWIDKYGDVDGDGFIEYTRRSSRGLSSQGWKDSTDAISHANGDLADGPVALCEVQGYVYAARLAGAELARVLGHEARALELHRQADLLRERFERVFFDTSMGSYVLALDGKNRPCAVRASNAGHCLWSGIATPEHARSVGDVLLGERMFSGWGIRTLAAGESRYNPLSYHNGSVWPHDNSLIAMGLARYGFKRDCARLLEALYDASRHFDLRRMPELFCGFRPRPLEGPTLYPVACAPQAWAAGAVFLLLQACLGVEIDAVGHRLILDRPVLPESIPRVHIRDLEVGGARVDLALVNHGEDTSVQLVDRDGDVDVVVLK